MLRAALLVLAFFSSPLRAGDVYVWVDDEGRKQISDLVPDKYRARAQKMQAPRQTAPPKAQEAAAPAPRAGGSPADECEALWRAYEDSRECIDFTERAMGDLGANPSESCAIAPAPPASCPPPSD